jgi:ferritin-like metal-binding protein YciE
MKDIYYAEKKLTKALPRMAKNATDPRLKEAFTIHAAQTEEQVKRLEEAFGVLGYPVKSKKCVAMDGLLEEANEHIEEYERGAGLDAAMIVGAQKVEHYEIAAYGSMRSFARTLGHTEAATIFEEIREQESDTDELLTNLAESVINPKAEEETEVVGEDGNSSGGGSRGGESGGREGGDDALSGGADGMATSGMTDGNNREGASETGSAMGY